MLYFCYDLTEGVGSPVQVIGFSTGGGPWLSLSDYQPALDWRILAVDLLHFTPIGRASIVTVIGAPQQNQVWVEAFSALETLTASSSSAVVTATAAADVQIWTRDPCSCRRRWHPAETGQT